VDKNCYQDFSLPGTFAPRSESSQWEPSLPATKVPGTFTHSWELLLQGTNVPGNFRSSVCFLTTLRDAYNMQMPGAAVKVNPQNISK